MVSWHDGYDTREPRPASSPASDDALAALRSRIDLSRLPPVSRAVTEQIICSAADLSYANDLVFFERPLEAAVAALASGAPVIADVPMVAAGIAECVPICKADAPLAVRLSRTAGITMAAAAVRLALAEAGPGAIWVVGCEPAAIAEVLARDAQPALVIGLPAGFVGAPEAKRALRDSGLPSLTNISEKGGPAIAVAGCLALLRLAGKPAPAPADLLPR